jgi:hypothetical protein
LASRGDKVNPQLGIVEGKNFTTVREFAEYEEYNKASERLADFSNDRQLFTIVCWNYDDYNNLLKKYSEELMRNPSTMDRLRLDAIVLDINRHILNYLSAVRSFLDHSETNLKKRYGPDSERVSRFTAACSNAYDNHFSYRFLYKLRNYAQHCGMPVGRVQFSKQLVDRHTKKVRYTLSLYFSRDSLLSKYDAWGSELTEEIQQFPPEFEINPHIDEMMKCLEKIESVLIEDDLPELIKSAQYIQEIIDSLKDRPGTPCILRLLDVTRDDKQCKLSIEWFPFQLIDMIMSIIPNDT